MQDKKTSDVELPPRPSGSNARKENIPLDASVTFDGDGEFGSQNPYLKLKIYFMTNVNS